MALVINNSVNRTTYTSSFSNGKASVILNVQDNYSGCFVRMNAITVTVDSGTPKRIIPTPFENKVLTIEVDCTENSTIQIQGLLVNINQTIEYSASNLSDKLIVEYDVANTTYFNARVRFNDFWRNTYTFRTNPTLTPTRGNTSVTPVNTTKSLLGNYEIFTGSVSYAYNQITKLKITGTLSGYRPPEKPQKGTLTGIDNRIQYTSYTASEAVLDASTNYYSATITMTIADSSEDLKIPYESPVYTESKVKEPCAFQDTIEAYVASYDSNSVKPTSGDHTKLVFELGGISSLSSIITLTGAVTPWYFAHSDTNPTLSNNIRTTWVSKTALTADVTVSLTNQSLKFAKNPPSTVTNQSGTSFQGVVNEVNQQSILFAGVEVNNTRDYLLDIVATLESAVPTIDTQPYGSIKVYQPSDDDLKEFGFNRYRPSGSTEKDEYIDIAKYVIKLHKVYFETKAGSTTNLIVGPYTVSSLQWTQPSSDVYIKELGSITIPHKNSDGNDYQTKIELYLPFLGWQTLSTDYIGHTLSVTYVINVVSGDGCVRLTDENNNIVESYNGRMSTDFFFITPFETTGTVDTSQTLLLGLKPFVTITYYVSKDRDRNSELVKGVIGELSGFHQIEEFKPTDDLNVLHDELVEIENLLRSGVIL